MKPKAVQFNLFLSGRASRRLVWLLVIPLLLACNLLNPSEEPTAAPVTPPVTVTAGTPVTEPAPETPATPTPAGPLPAALYFIDTNGQIMRLEADGTTLYQITMEPQAIDSFDVSPTDSSLVYVSGNSLIQTDAFGDGRVVKVTGGPTNPEDSITTAIGRPHFSPDGQQISFGYAGINLIPSGPSTQYVTVQPSDPIPDFSDPNNPPVWPEGPIRFFLEGSWSPDGQRLAISFAYYPEGGSIAIKELGSGQLTEISNDDYIACCHLTWGADSSLAYLASDLMVYGSPGLVEVDAATGQGTTLINGQPAGPDISPDDPARLFRSPVQLADGTLRYFVDLVTDPMEFGGSGFYTMFQSDANGANLVPLRPDKHRAGDIIWSPDGSGAVLVDASGSLEYPSSGPLLWLPADGAPVLGLAGSGRNPRWAGQTESGTRPPVQATAAPATAAPPTAAPPTVAPPTAVITPVSADPTAADLEALKQQFLAALGINPASGGIAGAAVLPFESYIGLRLYLAYTIGMRGFNPVPQSHALAVYRFESGWHEMARYTYTDGDLSAPPSPDFLNEGAAVQIFVEPAADWFTVDGGIGAHGGTFQALRFDGASLQSHAAGGNASPGAGFAADLNGDGWHEVIIDAADYYVFAYAAGVRLVDYVIYYWNGSQMVQVILAPLPAGSAGAGATNQALQFAAADLWYEAQVAASQALAADPGSATAVWNKAYIDLVISGRQPSGGCPVLENVFLGNYAAAEMVLQATGLDPADLFGPAGVMAACVVGQGYEETLTGHIVDFASRALTVLPDYPSAYFLRGWAAYLSNPADPAAVSDVQQAANLDPANGLYAAALAYLTG
jgi:hypothetical protein